MSKRKRRKGGAKAPGDGAAKQAPVYSDFGSPCLAQHTEVTLENADVKLGVLRARNKTPFALDRYHARKELDPSDDGNNSRLFDAGNRLRDDFTAAGLEPRIAGRYAEMVGTGSIQGFMAGRGTAYERWVSAVRAVGPIASDEIVSVCCLGNPVGRSRMILLRRGLEVLARHYRI
ncbi:MAG TPA: DUF6456 domain-containing protein [Limnochordia bacterium]